VKKESNFTLERKNSRYHLKYEIKINITVVSLCATLYSLMKRKTVPHICGTHPQNLKPQSNLRKHQQNQQN
jgi:hypothetical protein